MSDDYLEPPPQGGYTRPPPPPPAPPPAAPPQQQSIASQFEEVPGKFTVPSASDFEEVGSQSSSKPFSGMPWYIEPIAKYLNNNLLQHGNLMGREGALETSSKMAAEHPYKPGMTAGQMMGEGRGWQENPMLYAGAPSSLNAIGGVMGAMRPGMPQAAPPGAAPSVVPAVTEMPFRGVPQSFRPPEMAGMAAGPAEGEMPYRGTPQGVRPPESSAIPTGQAAADAIAPAEATSTLAGAIANNTPSIVDQSLTRAYRGAVSPSRTGAAAAPQIDQQDQRILTAIDQIIENKSNLKMTDPNTGEVVTGQLPRTLRQFSDALDQIKRVIFGKYDTMARGAGDLGVQVDLYPAAQKLRELSQLPEIVDFHPNLVPQMERLAATLESRATYSPSAAQDVIENLNQTVKSTRNAPPTESTPTYNAVLLKVVPVIRKALDEAIESASGPGYQELKRQYGSLASIEKDVANATLREGVKQGRIPSELADLWSGEEIMRGLITLPFSPTHGAMSLLKGTGMQVMRRMYDHVNGPNKAIERLFQRRQGMIAPVMGPGYRMGMPSVGQMGGEVGRGDRPPSQRRREMRIPSAGP